MYLGGCCPLFKFRWLTFFSPEINFCVNYEARTHNMQLTVTIMNSCSVGQPLVSHLLIIHTYLPPVKKIIIDSAYPLLLCAFTDYLKISFLSTYHDTTAIIIIITILLYCYCCIVVIHSCQEKDDLQKLADLYFVFTPLTKWMSRSMFSFYKQLLTIRPITDCLIWKSYYMHVGTCTGK